jgi:HD-GYP domain-containing protein (c-di-GMP phosphodiesterase class II)
MTTDRPYRKALPDQVALDELKKFAGIQFDQQVVEAFIRAYQKGKVRSVGKNTA